MFLFLHGFIKNEARIEKMNRGLTEPLNPLISDKRNMEVIDKNVGELF